MLSAKESAFAPKLFCIVTKRVGEGHVLVELKVLAVLVAEVLSSGQDQRIIVVVVGLAVAAAVKDASIVQHAAVAFLHFAQALN